MQLDFHYGLLDVPETETTMTATVSRVTTTRNPTIGSIRARIDHRIEEILAALPHPATLSAVARRGIIARYTAVLEGNLIYWMTAAYVCARSDEARVTIVDNLLREVRGHLGMLHRFAAAARALPTGADSEAVSRDLMNVRLFLERLAAVPNIVTMAFFEGFIQRFMPFLADVARRCGSSEMEYTDVHGVRDITHTQELFRALEAELALAPVRDDETLFEGVDLLSQLIATIVNFNSAPKR